MKKLLTIVAAVMLLVGVAGNAMAFFDLGDLQLVVYEGAPGGTGNEAHFDLNVGRDITQNYSNVDTGISLLNDFSATNWTDIKVGVFGGGLDTNFANANPLFGSDTDTFGLGNPFAGFQGAVTANSFYDMSSWGANQKEVEPKASGPYTDTMQFGTTAGIYAGLLQNPATTFGAEAVLNGSILSGFDLYEYDLTTQSASLVGNFTFDTTGDNLLVSYNQVPVPAAVWLLGSGLLALVGIRRRKN